MGPPILTYAGGPDFRPMRVRRTVGPCALAKVANARDGFGWFLLALIISPLIALLLVLVMRPKVHEAAIAAPNQSSPQPFEPDGIHAGIPYRVTHDGSINAIIQGTIVRRSFAPSDSSELARKSRREADRSMGSVFVLRGQ